jgi:hypothetical protein
VNPLKPSLVISRSALLFILFPAALIFSEPAENPGLFEHFGDYFYSNFEFAPEFFFDADVRYLGHYKSSYYKQHYFLENNTNLEFVLLSFKKKILLIGSFMIINGMGRSPGDIVFDPIDIGYGLSPMLEFRFKKVNAQAGLAHHCFHQIDRQDMPTVYYNNPVISVGSKNLRLHDYFFNLSDKQHWTFADRFSWHGITGIYMSDFFGLVGRSKINGINPYRFDFTGEFRYCFYRRGKWIFNTKTFTMVGWFHDVPDNKVGEGIGWKQDIALEADFRRGIRGGQLSLGYTFDDLPLYPTKLGTERLPRFSYDRIVRIALKFFI